MSPKSHELKAGTPADDVSGRCWKQVGVRTTERKFGHWHACGEIRKLKSKEVCFSVNFFRYVVMAIES